MTTIDTRSFDSADEPFQPAPEEARAPLLPDPGFLWQVFRRNALLVFGLFFLVLLCAAAYLATATPMYSATASMIVEPASGPVRTSEPVSTGMIPNTDEIDTEIRLMSSPLVAQIAAHLYSERFASPDGDPFTKEEVEVVAARMTGTTRILRSGSSKIIDITSNGPDAQFAAATANLIGEAYLQSQIDNKSQRSQSTQEFLNERLSELEHNALTAQAALDNYRAARGLVTSNSGTNAEQEVSNLNTQLASARAELAEKQGRLNAARQQLARGSGGADVGAALGSGTIASLRQQEARASAELAVLTERYGELYPERRQTESELADIRRRIQEEINRVLSNLQADVQTAQSRVASLTASRQTAIGAMTTNSRAQAGLNELTQKAEAAQAIYQSFLERSQEGTALRDSEMPDARFATRAEVPKSPYSPNYVLTIALAIVLGLVVGFVGLLTSEYLRRGVQTKRDVERRLRLRYAGAIPTLKSTVKGRQALEAPQDYVLSHPHSLFAEAFRSIRTFLMLSPGKRSRAIAITSALPGEGKTTTSVCLGRTAAAEGLKTILVDADLRRRGSSELLQYESDHDIYDYLLRDTPIEQCIYRDEMSGLDILGSNEVPESGQNPLREDTVDKMLAELRSRYDVVIIDTAPVLGVAESRLLASTADRVLVITHWRKTSIRAIEAVVDMLIDSGAKVTGLALSQVNIKKYASTGDGDVYAYAKKFRGYYNN
ncbi:polysaccharide biosynthesis tyrosine autokinase [Aurantiacibacter xanthus]|uniref:non-specific protein-tyrosine kinase n=1 Tax=Aurantiacibacter xanthus TaxID=1784712 RepID=A0A3A1P9V0_9SPHN|nr:polysaccharide biosynthesis tyrosine autokinase [Aurantiacibacter xanthus]RIV89771.1 polysaccharide biosynthesis tyrosine autokinase [Aurantiacibacter xanthus]